MAHRLSCSPASGIFLDQGSNLCPLHYMVDSLPPSKNEKNEDSLRDLWDNIKHTNIHIIRVPEGQGGEKRPEKIFEEIIAEDFSNIGKK